MREFDIDLTDYITNGITPDRQHVQNKPGLQDCKELIIASDGLRARPSILELNTDYGSFADYPYPMLFDNLGGLLTVNDEGTIDYDSGDSVSDLKAIEIVDFNQFGVINTGDRLIEYTVEDGSYATLIDPSEEVFTSVCKYNDAQSFGVVDNWLYWSRIGLFSFDLSSENIAGRIPLPFPGDGVRVMQLGTNIICYGDSGICAMSPVTQPTGAWKLVKLPQFDGIGLKSFYGVADTGDSHVFVGNDDNLWNISNELKIERLGFEQLLNGMEEINCTYIAKYGAVYLSDADKCYVFTQQGMTRVQHYSRSLVPYFDADYKIAGYPNTAKGYNQFEVVTLPIDFKLRAVKHIQAIEANIRATGTVECAIDWRMSMNDDFRSTGWVRLNPAGVVHIPCSGVDFRIKLRGDVDKNFYLASLLAKIKYENKTTLRGKYAN